MVHHFVTLVLKYKFCLQITVSLSCVNIFVQFIASEDKNFMMIIQFVMRGSVLRRFQVLVIIN